ncbi:MAG: phosphoribosylaminoimidazolesuccinocarboxamide synthase [Flavobacteriaceae bacterium]|nr:phosphoribosylaminoimidazolesuccinocarboxamide synthase [Flavobacteriaceae bacterium]
MTNTLMKIDLNLKNVKSRYSGKVREIYYLENDLIVIIVTDRLSAFDVVLPKGIPYKGQILNQIALKMLYETKNIVPNWLIESPDPNVSVGRYGEPFKIEMVIRGYLSGHAARIYKSGLREICGIKLQEGMKENDKFDNPIITPTTKADKGHDVDISKDEIISKGIVSEKDYNLLEEFTRKLFKKGTEIAKNQGLILVDTKYEFGKLSSGEIILLDEIHTPDSSRYFYENGYNERQKNNLPQKQLSKEFVREWLISNGFQGLEKQKLPEFHSAKIESISNRYIELYEKITGENFEKPHLDFIEKRIQTNLEKYFNN